MVSVPLWLLILPFELTEYETLALPLPFAPAVMCAQPALLTAVQAHPDGAVTFTLPDPPPEANETELEESE